MAATNREDATKQQRDGKGAANARGSFTDRPEEQLGQSARLSIGEFALFALRVALGLSMLQVAYKLIRDGWDGWLNASGLLPGVVRGPLGDIYAAIWGNEIVLWLVILGAGAVGIGLTLGLLTRLSALVGTFMMIGFYTADLPPSSGWFEVQLVQIFAFFAVASLGAGHVWGVDQKIRELESRSRWWYVFLG